MPVPSPSGDRDMASEEVLPFIFLFLSIGLTFRSQSQQLERAMECFIAPLPLEGFIHVLALLKEDA
eukprot:7671923-Prorocentrum_lima.AAC.1